VLALEERGDWSPLATGGCTRALALDGDTAWAGGSEGVISVSLSGGVSATHRLPWGDAMVRAMAIGTDGSVWAAGDGSVADLDDGVWQTHTVPLTGTARALAVDPSEVAVWLGGGDIDGGVAVYDGSWKVEGAFGAPVTALAVDETGRAWAGTWGNGVYRQDGDGGWTNHRVTDGLASDYVLGAVAGEGAVWFGAKPYVGTPARGGISRYDLIAEMWRVYTQAHGLPAVDLSVEHEAPDCIYALDRGADGKVWAGTEQGVSFLAGEDWWASYTATHGLRTGPVMAISVEGETVVAATSRGLDVLDRSVMIGEAPTAQIDAVSPLKLSARMTLTLRGGGADNDEGGGRVVAWDWSSDLDGPLCTLADCELPSELFTPGEHVISLRVQDDEGSWSEVVQTTVIFGDAWQIYLPLIVRG
jgi:ligand-binding sensor domain-containing protein